MSDGAEDDDGEKPLDPSEKRLNDALEEGNQPFAREAPMVAMLAALSVTLGILMVPVTIRISDRLALLFEHAGRLELGNRQDGLLLLRGLALDVGVILLPVLAVFVVAGVLASVLQNPPRVIAHRIAPKAAHVSPVAGFRRIFGAMGLMEFARAVVKLLVILVVLAGVLWGARKMMAATMMMAPAGALDVLLAVTMSLVSAVLVAASVILSVDVLWSRHHWLSNLRMTHQQARDEMKESDGDPHLKAKRLSLQRQAMKRMMAEVPKAAVIITNPTHVAVALRYDAGGAGVPQLVAKGVDDVARRIKEIAAEHGVPMVEDVPLARALNQGVALGAYIPREFFEVVAQVIHLITVRRPARGTVLRRQAFANRQNPLQPPLQAPLQAPRKQPG